MLDSERHHDRRLQLHNNRHRSFLTYAKVEGGMSIWFINDLVAKNNYKPTFSFSPFGCLNSKVFHKYEKRV